MDESKKEKSIKLCKKIDCMKKKARNQSYCSREHAPLGNYGENSRTSSWGSKERTYKKMPSIYDEKLPYVPPEHVKNEHEKNEIENHVIQNKELSKLSPEFKIMVDIAANQLRDMIKLFYKDKNVDINLDDIFGIYKSAASIHKLIRMKYYESIYASE